METTLYPPNAILFVFDPSNKSVEVPKYGVGVLTASNGTCVSVGTQAEADGEVRVILTDTLVIKDDLSIVFQGRIRTPGKRVAVVTSVFDVTLEVDAVEEETSLAVWTDDPKSPSIVVVETQPELRSVTD